MRRIGGLRFTAIIFYSILGITLSVHAQQGRSEITRPHDVTYNEYEISKDGVETLISTRYRTVDTEGTWKMVAKSMRTGRVNHFGPYPGHRELWMSFQSAEFLRNHPNFSHTDKVAGFEVYVIKHYLNESQGEWEVEESYSPVTGYTPLRTVVKFGGGTMKRIEATKVEFKDGPATQNEKKN